MTSRGWSRCLRGAWQVVVWLCASLAPLPLCDVAVALCTWMLRRRYQCVCLPRMTCRRYCAALEIIKQSSRCQLDGLVVSSHVSARFILLFCSPTLEG